jgi:hypothetical protein
MVRCMRDQLSRRRPELRSWLSSLQGTGLIRPRRPGSAFLLMCVWFLLRGVQRALRLQPRPFEQRFDTKVHTGEATATTTEGALTAALHAWERPCSW